MCKNVYLLHRVARNIPVLVTATLILGLSQVSTAEVSESQEQGITGGGVRGITGGGVRGITGGGVRGITGGGVRGITGGGVRGITGGGVRGITGGGVRGITGGGVRSAPPAVAGFVSTYFDAAALGPVESIQTEGAIITVTVLGQQFRATAVDVSAGDYVVAAGDAEGQLVALYPIGSPYVPGASAVGILGKVTAVNSATATLIVGGAVVDYSAHLAIDPAYAPKPGDLINLEGVQPLQQGTILVGFGSNLDGARR